MNLQNPICVALDTPEISRAQDLVHMLKGHVGMVKIGMEFFYAHGPQGYEAVAALGIPVFLDLKLHDIPNTVASALKSLLRLSPIPAIINIHASGGGDMMKAARDAVEGRCKLIAVTVLTSLSNADIAAIGFARSTDEQALLLAKLTHQAGLDGIVCSALDLAKVRTELPRKFLTVVPGIRPADASTQDQKRVMTPKQAITAGANILVIGRPITGAADPAQAALDIVTSLT
ncbi:MAG: orotidine-5'-phosphate decarboxylase [Aestuariivirga sp.]